MEHFVVSARKYRPENFEDVVGQKAITNTLLKAIDSNHLAQALLFTGPRGVGKTSCARILAKKINQDENTSDDQDYSFNIFELDAASNNSVDDIRALTDQVRIPPQTGKYKVYIIDEVHMLSQSAFNAFLKTLEEPPKHAIFILATTEKHKIIPTILSRCQIFDFKRITVNDIKEHLGRIAQKEGVTADDDALHIIAQKADGAMRDALSTYDRVVSYCGDQLNRKAVAENLNVLDYDSFFETTDLLLTNNIPNALVYFNQILSKGFDGQHFIAGLASHFRDLLVAKNPATVELLEVGSNTKKRYLEQSKNADYNFLMTALDLASECDFKYKNSQNQRLLVELCLMKMASISSGNLPQKKNPDVKIKSPSEVKTQSENTPVTEQPKAKDDTINTTTETNQGNATNLQKESLEEIQNPEESKKTSSSTSTENSTTNHSNNETNNAETTALASTESQTSSEKKLDHQSENENNTASTEKDDTTSNSVEDEVKEAENEIKKTSGFSLKAIQKKKELIAAKEKNKPKEVERFSEFTEEELQEAWKSYTEKIERRGNKILASVYNSDQPILKNKKIYIELPNETMKISVLQDQANLMKFLKEKLDNTEISLEIKVNHVQEKKYAFTPREKYQKLVEVNPSIEKLRKTFELDI